MQRQRGRTHIDRRSLRRSRRLGFGLAVSFVAIAALGPTSASAYLYSANGGTNSIGRANLDGSGASQSFVVGANSPLDVAVDAGHVYWANDGTGKIGRANLNGSGINQSFINTGSSFVRGLAVDGGHIYWASFSTIGRANLNGTGIDQSFITGAAAPYGVAVDAAHVYWANHTSTTIGRANLNGAGVKQNFLAGGSGLAGLAVDALLPPNTKIKSAAVNSAKRKASFRFSSSQPRSRFSCSLDGKSFRSCASPKTYKHLKMGRHTFEVKTRNRQGVTDPSPATRTFRI